MRSKRFDGIAVSYPGIVFLRERKPYSIGQGCSVKWPGARGEVLGETIAQPAPLEHFKTAGGDAAAAWVRGEGSCKLRLAPRGA